MRFPSLRAISIFPCLVFDTAILGRADGTAPEADNATSWCLSLLSSRKSWKFTAIALPLTDRLVVRELGSIERYWLARNDPEPIAKEVSAKRMDIYGSY